MPASGPRPAPIPEEWRGIVGEYGSDRQPLHLYERDGVLHVRVLWTIHYPLVPVSDSVFAFPERGLYQGERLTVQRDAAGSATGIEIGGVRSPRRAVGPGDAGQLRVTPLAPVPDVLAAARMAQPPPQPEGLRAPDLIDLAALDTTLQLDVRYATENNFLGTPFYASARVFLQRPAAEAVVRAQRWLSTRGYGLLIHDGYRPWYVTRAFWDATPPAARWMVADPRAGSRHNRGCAVDLTMYDLAFGTAVEMPSGYDEMTPRAYPDYKGGPPDARGRRDLLRQAMERHGFTVEPNEWWHFNYTGWEQYPILDIPFSAVK